MKRWHLPTLEPSSDKRTAREPGADAPRVPSVGTQKPRVLFSSPECRLIALDLGAGEELPEHHVRERAVVQVISGRVAIDASGETVECEAGTLVTFDPGERHALHGLDDAQATADARALASGRTRRGDGATRGSTSACKRHRRAARLATLRRGDEEH